MHRVGWALSAAFGAALFAPDAARAQELPPSYALAWVRGEGAEDCPSGRALAADVERRIGRKVFDAAAERSFEVEVMRFGSRYRSDVYVRDAAGKTIGHRTLESDEPSCSALFGATALAVALVIDPEAASRPAPAEAAFEAPPPPAAPAPPAPPAPPPTFVVPAPPPPRPAEREATEVWFAPRGLVAGGLVPGASPGLSLATVLHPPGRWGFSAVVSYTLPRTSKEGAGDLDISLTRLTTALTFDVLRGPGYRVLLAAGPSLGAFHVAVREPAPVTNPGDFLFAGVEAGLEVQMLVTSNVFVDLGGHVVVPLLRQQFLTQALPTATGLLWEQPPLAGVGFLGVGARFP